jgi:hypothetical protein
MTRWKGKISDRIAKMVVNPDGMTLNEHAKKSKYNSKKTEVDGIIFDSKRESEFYRKLLMLKKIGEVMEIELQPRLDYLITYSANGNTYEKTAFYRGDFKVTFADGRWEIWDAKGFRTLEFRRKKKIIEKLYGIQIIEK